MSARLRALTALAAAALVAPLLPLAAAPAFAEGEATPPPTQSITDFCANVPDDFEPFTDVDGNTFKVAIECLAFAQVAQGGPGGRPADIYGPDIEVGRGQMATFIAKVIDTAGRLDTGDNIRELPAYDGTPQFTDTEGTTHEANIERLADADIVRGGPNNQPATTYDPDGPVTRAQMATFINEALRFMTGEPSQTSDDYYTDDSDSIHEGNINGITSLGLARGEREDTYNPELDIDRDNMAEFLARTLAELEERGDIGPGLPEQNIQVNPDSPATFDAVTSTDTSSADDRGYTATGLIPGEEYRVTLVEASTVGENAAGETTFTDSDNDNLAEVGDRTADITTVNGAPAQNNTGEGSTSTPTDATNGGTAVGEATSNGTLTFVVDGDEDGESVLPLVYRNGGTGNTAEEGGTSPRLELNDDDTAAEPVDIGGTITYEQSQETASVTEGPDLVSAALAVQGEDFTTVRFTFDEAVTGTGVDEDGFSLYTFDGQQITADDDDRPPLRDPNDARRDTADELSVLVVFPITADEFGDVTLATVTETAVEDAAGTPNPIGDVALGSGVTFPAGVTDAPDLISIGNFRPSPATTGATLVDFVFDEDAFVVDGGPGQFELVQPDGDDLQGQAVDNTTTSTTGDFVGDGTNTITVSVTNEDTNGDGNNNETITAASVVRGTVQEGTVSDEQQVNPNPLNNPAEGSLNPLQVTDANGSGTTEVPDLVSATVNETSSSVTFVFDEDVLVVDEELFRVYDRDGVETAGTARNGSDTDPDDATVIITFPAGSLDNVAGASVEEGAVRENGTTATTPVNQEDEVATSSAPIAARSTTGPDLTDVNRELETETTVDRFTGERTTEVVAVTIRFIFDDEAALAGSSTNPGGSFFVVEEDGTSTELTNCEQAEDTAADGDENVVVCDVPEDNDPVTPGNQGTAEFEAARDAVLGTVESGAVVDDEGTENPEGAEVIAGA